MVARFEENDFPGEPLAVIAGQGHAYVLPPSAARLDGDSLALLGAIQERALEAAALEAEMSELTATGREMGISWSLLAAAQGVTGEALRRRSLEA